MLAQTAICFLYQFFGRTLSEIYGKNSNGIEITIKLACCRELNHELKPFQKKSAKNGVYRFYGL